MEHDTLSAEEAAALRRIAGLMIPEDPEHGVPAADDPAIADDIVASVGRDLNDVRSAIQTLLPRLKDHDAEDAVIRFLDTPSRASLALSRAVLQCYYRDERVLRSLGHDERPPFPRGNTVDQGDWSLLDVVRNRPPLWRDDRSATHES